MDFTNQLDCVRVQSADVYTIYSTVSKSRYFSCSFGSVTTGDLAMIWTCNVFYKCVLEINSFRIQFLTLHFPKIVEIIFPGVTKVTNPFVLKNGQLEFFFRGLHATAYCGCTIERIEKKSEQPRHCKETVPKIRNKYSQKRHGSASVLISTFMCLPAIYIFPSTICLFCRRKICDPIPGIYKLLPDTRMWKLGLTTRNSFSGNT